MHARYAVRQYCKLQIEYIYMYKMIICIEDTIGVAGKIRFGTKICVNQSKQTNHIPKCK